jgi:hypothetical protein
LIPVFTDFGSKGVDLAFGGRLNPNK